MAEDSNSGAGQPGSNRPISEGRFAELFRSSYPMLWGVAWGMTGNRADAEDVVQEAGLIGFRKRDAYVEGTRFDAWMGAIVRHVANNQRRKNTRHHHQPLHDHPTSPGPAFRPASLESTAKGMVDADAQAFDDRLLIALRTLSPVARACLLLRTLHGMDYQAIAEIMDIPQNTALSHVHRARQSLRAILATPCAAASVDRAPDGPRPRGAP